MSFKTVFDLSTERVNYFTDFLSPAYLFFILGIGLIIFYKTDRKKTTQTTKSLIIGIVAVFISSIFILVFLGGQILEIRKAKHIMQNKKFLIVEGIPENYHPMPKEGHDTEHFDIRGIHFEYSDYIIAYPGYHNAASLGVVITPDNYYRLPYYKLDDMESSDPYNNRIVKIEILQ